MPTTPAALAATPHLDGSGTAPFAGRALVSYYLLGSPLFFLLDVFFGLSIRAAFLDNEPMLRFLYYAMAFVCGLVAVRRPEWSGVVALVESGANIALLVFGVMLSYYAAVDAAAAEGPLASPFGATSVVNLVLSASILTATYIRQQGRWNLKSNKVFRHHGEERRMPN